MPTPVITLRVGTEKTERWKVAATKAGFKNLAEWVRHVCDQAADAPELAEVVVLPEVALRESNKPAAPPVNASNVGGKRYRGPDFKPGQKK